MVSRAPDGGHTLYVYTHVPYRPRVDPDDAGERVERRIEQFAPGLRDLVLARSLRPPQALEAENPSLVRGDILGGSCDPDQQLLFRSAPRLVRHSTPVRGLYLAGASVHPGGSVHGVPGAGAARALMHDRRRRPRGRRR